MHKRLGRILGGQKAILDAGGSAQGSAPIGYSIAELDAAIDASGGLCAICRRPSTRKLAMDHCHATGKLRGLLCQPCNTGLGHFQDDVERMQRAIDYLRNAAVQLSESPIINQINARK